MNKNTNGRIYWLLALALLILVALGASNPDPLCPDCGQMKHYSNGVRYQDTY